MKDAVGEYAIPGTELWEEDVKKEEAEEEQPKKAQRRSATKPRKRATPKDVHKEVKSEAKTPRKRPPHKRSVKKSSAPFDPTIYQRYVKTAVETIAVLRSDRAGWLGFTSAYLSLVKNPDYHMQRIRPDQAPVTYGAFVFAFEKAADILDPKNLIWASCREDAERGVPFQMESKNSPRVAVVPLSSWWYSASDLWEGRFDHKDSQGHAIKNLHHWLRNDEDGKITAEEIGGIRTRRTYDIFKECVVIFMLGRDDAPGKYVPVRWVRKFKPSDAAHSIAGFTDTVYRCMVCEGYRLNDPAIDSLFPSHVTPIPIEKYYPEPFRMGLAMHPATKRYNATPPRTFLYPCRRCGMKWVCPEHQRHKRWVQHTTSQVVLLDLPPDSSASKPLDIDECLKRVDVRPSDCVGMVSDAEHQAWLQSCVRDKTPIIRCDGDPVYVNPAAFERAWILFENTLKQCGGKAMVFARWELMYPDVTVMLVDQLAGQMAALEVEEQETPAFTGKDKVTGTEKGKAKAKARKRTKE